jgi:hypothetical protein
VALQVLLQSQEGLEIVEALVAAEEEILALEALEILRPNLLLKEIMEPQELSHTLIMLPVAVAVTVGLVELKMAETEQQIQ